MARVGNAAQEGRSSRSERGGANGERGAQDARDNKRAQGGRDPHGTHGLRERLARSSVKTAFSLYATGALATAIVLSLISTSVLGLLAESTLLPYPFAYSGTFVFDEESISLLPAEVLSWYETPAYENVDGTSSTDSGSGGTGSNGEQEAGGTGSVGSGNVVSDVNASNSGANASANAGNAADGTGGTDTNDGSQQSGTPIVLYVETAASDNKRPIDLGSPPAEALGETVVDLEWARRETPNENLPLGKIASYHAATAPSRAGATEAASLSASMPPNANGERPLVSNIGYYIPFAEDSQLYRLIANIAVLSVPVIFATCFIVAGRLLYRNRIARPVAAMDAAARRIAAGDLDFKVEPQREDELGQLCAQFETMRAELFRSKGEMWHAAENRRRVNAAFAHDLRTPLTVVKGRAEFVSMATNDDRVKEAAAAISRQADRLAHYADSMSGLDSLESAPARRTPVALEHLITQVAEDARTAAGTHATANREIAVTCTSHNLPAFTMTDASALLRIADNLTSNAIRHASASVEIELSWENDMLTLAVTDDGPGFGASAKRALEPFWRGEERQGTSAGGANGHMGLGLYICSVLCAKHGGALSVADCPEGGGIATARVLAPACKPEGSAAPEAAAAPEATTTPEPEPEPEPAAAPEPAATPATTPENSAHP